MVEAPIALHGGGEAMPGAERVARTLLALAPLPSGALRRPPPRASPGRPRRPGAGRADGARRLRTRLALRRRRGRDLVPAWGVAARDRRPRRGGPEAIRLRPYRAFTCAGRHVDRTGRG